MPFALEDAKAILSSLVRSIDKKADYALTFADDDHRGVKVALSLRNRSTTVTVSTEDLEAAGQNSMRRSQVRTTLKRALDRMTFETIPIASTRMLRGKTDAGGFFRPAQGFRGRR